MTKEITTNSKIGYLTKYGRYSYSQVEEVNVLHPTTGNPSVKLRQKFKGLPSSADNVFFDEIENLQRWSKEDSVNYRKKLVKIVNKSNN